MVVTLKDLEPGLSLQKAGVTAVLRIGSRIAETAANVIAESLVSVLVAS